MSSSARVGSSSRATSTKTKASGKQASRERSPWFAPSFPTTASERTTRNSCLLRPIASTPDIIIESTEHDERIAISRAHLARKAHQKRRHQSTRATSEDITMAIGSPTPTVRQPTVDFQYIYRPRRPRRSSTTKTRSPLPALTPSSSSSSLGPESDFDRSSEQTFYSDGTSSYVQSRYSSMASQMPFSGLSSHCFSPSPLAQLSNGSHEQESMSMRPVSSGPEFDWELIENMACLSDDGVGPGSSPFTSQGCFAATHVQSRSASSALALELTPREHIPEPTPSDRRSVYSSLESSCPNNSQYRVPGNRESSALSLVEAPPSTMNMPGEPPIDAPEECLDEDRLFSRTEELLRLHKEEVDPDLWDEDHEQFESRHQERSKVYNMLYKLAQGEMRQKAMMLPFRTDNRNHEPDSSATIRSDPPVSSNQVVSRELRPPRNINTEPVVAIPDSKPEESREKTALEAPDSNRAPKPRREPRPKPQRGRSPPPPQEQEQAQLVVERCAPMARPRTRSMARQCEQLQCAVSGPVEPELSRALPRPRPITRLMEATCTVPRVELHVAARDPNYDFSENRPLQELRHRAGRQYTPNTRRLKSDEKLMKGLSASTRDRDRSRARK